MLADMDLNALLSGIGGAAGGAAIAGGICYALFKQLLKKDMAIFKHDLAITLQNHEQMVELAQEKWSKDYSRQLQIRDKAEKVAELLSVAYTRDCTTEKFNRLAWEVSLWLPADIVQDLAHCLCKSDKPVDPMDILIKVRKHLLDKPQNIDKPDELKADNIVMRPLRAQFSDKQREKAEEIFAAVVAVQMALGSYYDKLLHFNHSTAENKALLKPALVAAADLFTQLDRELLALQIRTGYYFDEISFELVTEFRTVANEAFNTFIHYAAHTPAQVVDARKLVIVARDNLAARYRELQ